MGTKDDIKALATKEELEEREEELQEWARARFTRKESVLSLLRKLEQAQAERAARELQATKNTSSNSIYIGNLGPNDTEKNFKDGVQKNTALSRDGFTTRTRKSTPC